MHASPSESRSQRTWVLRRLVDGLLVLWLTHLAVFTALRLLPGDPFAGLVGERSLPAAAIEHLRSLYGHDGNVLSQYAREITARIQGDFGLSLKIARGTPVLTLLASAAPVSLAIGCGALLVGLVLGSLGGAIAARSRAQGRGTVDRGVRVLSSLGLCLPDFVLGTALLLVFSLSLHWLPAGGLDSPSALILPVLTLGLPLAAAIARLTRASLVDELTHDFIRTARAKGASETALVIDHALRPAAGPVVAYLAQAAAAVLTGSLVVETLFAVPGLGHAFVAGALSQDWTVVSGAALLYTALLVLFNLSADVVQAWMDPRTR